VGRLNISPRVATAGLVGLVALNVVLVSWALKSNNTNPASTASVSIGSAAATVTPTPTPSLTPSPTATPTPTPTPTATRPTTAPAAPLRTMLVAIDGMRAWRISVGSCAAGGSTVSKTTNGGATWADATSPLSTIVRVQPTDSQVAFVIGADSTCSAGIKRTSNGGRSWTSGSAVGSAWFRDPKSPVNVMAPGPSTVQPCGQREVVDLSVLSLGSAEVLCADGQVRSTTNTGSSWTDVGKASGAVAMDVSSATPATTYVAILDAPGCAGVQVRRIDQSAPTSCVSTAVPKTPGMIALSLVPGGGWLSVGDTTIRSPDNLLTWRAS
jgi:hypothetical protein